ncbi:uncharacterized protein CC84DRAFT_1168741 [Paraphaeosphaeria sporulosa]|uniref:Nucleoside 2-deoxyribosyltransferase n=1 Tax=Paraphaeosphaeria sporulosa TaxID=1460663 RepID=A0A177C1H1_9PLEO|nr:uncharacterized protein CC84DRAFT_1168741 [Paraphaeosphaeria sporulosa]OAG00682.1 hypothetical protein CC84DRAFT_1168741 [Paraphaeosphaeria sporulosa]
MSDPHPAAPVTNTEGWSEEDIALLKAFKDPTACKFCKRPSRCQECNHELVPEPKRPAGKQNIDVPRPDLFGQLPPPIANPARHRDFSVQFPPEALALGAFSVFAAGSIEMGKAIPWQRLLENHLCDLPITICNPRRGQWDPAVTQRAKDAAFREQVEWELGALTASTVICFFFDHATMSPVTLMELGLWAHSNKVVVCCNGDYWKGGNVHIVCERYGVPVVESFSELVPLVRAMLRTKGCIVGKSGNLTENEAERDPERSMSLDEAEGVLKGALREKQGIAIDRKQLGIAE